MLLQGGARLCWWDLENDGERKTKCHQIHQVAPAKVSQLWPRSVVWAWGIKGADLCKDLLSLNRLEPVSGCIKYGWEVGADSLSRLPRRESPACRRDFNDHRYSQADLHVSTSTMSRPWDLPPGLMASPGTAGQCHGNVGRRELLLEAIRRLDPTGFWVLEESEVS